MSQHVTSDYELGSQVGSGCSIGSKTGVAATVLRCQAEEEDVAGEDVILDLEKKTSISGPICSKLSHLNVSARREHSAILPPLDIAGHVARGDGAGHLGPVSLLEVPIKGEGGDLGGLNSSQENVASGSVPLAIGHDTRILSTITLSNLLKILV